MAFRWARELSLSYKLPLFVGMAVASIIVIALAPAWLRMRELVYAGELELSRTLLNAWTEEAQADPENVRTTIANATVTTYTLPEAREQADAGRDAIGAVLEKLSDAEPVGAGAVALVETWEGLARRYTYAELRAGADGEPRIVVLARVSENAGLLLGVNTLYVFAAGLVVLGVALVAFYLITSRLVLRPVRALRLWAEAVRDGAADDVVEVESGDEFGELADTCNRMLAALRDREVKLRAMNASLDEKLNQLADANAALDQASRLKGEFIANMSHELRTPLNAIIGFGDLLLDFARQDAAEAAGDDNPPPVIERRARYLEHIVTAARGLLGLIESMLEAAKIEAGRVTLSLERTDIAELCRGAVAMLEPQASRRGVRVSLDARSGVPTVETDPRKVEQIALNLISNAVKFAGTSDTSDDSDGGEVEVRVETLVGDSPWVRISVIDDGPGIAPEDQDRIFQKFEQLDASETKAYGGAGLGLAISRELASLLQGDLQLVSTLGAGSMFSLILPVKFDHERGREQAAENRFRGMLARS